MAKIALYPSLEDKVVLITGGASGIGESIVKKFLEQCSKVAFIDKEKKLGLNLVKKLHNYNHKPIFVECDLINIPKLKKSNSVKSKTVKPKSVKSSSKLSKISTTSKVVKKVKTKRRTVLVLLS